MEPILHLSLPVKDLVESRAFYAEVLGCEVGREREGWLDVWFFGLQLTLHKAPDEVGTDMGPGHRHFGVTLGAEELDAVLGRLNGAPVKWLSEPRTDFPDTEREQRKSMLLDPNGYAIELKSYRDPERAFAD